MMFPNLFLPKGGNNAASQDSPQETPVEPTPFTPSSILLRKIQGFQTITTFLGQIQCQAPFKPYDFLKDQHVTQKHRDEIQLCDSFAHLAVIQHDVVALATNRNNTQLEIVACTSTSAEKDKGTPPDDSQKPPSNLFKNCLSFFYTRNTRFYENMSTPVTTLPSIIEAKAPAGYPENPGSETLYQYLNDLEENCITGRER